MKSSRKNRTKKKRLCDFCDSINFELVGFYASGFDTVNSFESPERPIREVLENLEKCFFCKKIAEFYYGWSRENFDKQAPNLQDERNHVEYFIEPTDFFIEDAMGQLVRLQVNFNILMPSPERGVHCTSLEFQKWRVYGPSLQFQKCSQPRLKVRRKGGSLCEWESGGEQAYSGRIRPLLADARLFRKWKETCCAVHGDHCNSIFESGRRLPRLRLIDVEKRCVVDCFLHEEKGYFVGDEVGISYTALSYVWGKDKLRDKIFPELTKKTENEYRQPRSITRKKVLSTIDDAIEVTLDIGEKYLWVDCLCILQDNEDDKQKFIRQMDSIYGFASVTIVAASGDNANAGLPGTGPNSRTHIQKPFTIKGVSLLQTLDPAGTGDVLSYLGESVWYRRGWTFQEKIFSKRALIFTPEQVYWECQKTTWCEDGLWETMESPPVYRHSFAEKDFRHPWPLEVGSFEKIYRKLVEEYSKRMLTYESDGLDAFAGILNAFEMKAGQRFLWALPTSFLSNALTWRCSDRLYKRRQEMCTVSVEKGEGSSDGMITRCPFPSWSWVGWVGEVCIASSHGRLDAETVDLIFFYLDGSGSLKQVESTVATQKSF